MNASKYLLFAGIVVLCLMEVNGDAKGDEGALIAKGEKALDIFSVDLADLLGLLEDITKFVKRESKGLYYRLSKEQGEALKENTKRGLKGFVEVGERIVYGVLEGSGLSFIQGRSNPLQILAEDVLERIKNAGIFVIEDFVDETPKKVAKEGGIVEDSEHTEKGAKKDYLAEDSLNVHIEKGSEKGYLAKDSEHAEKGSEEGYLAKDSEHAEKGSEEGYLAKDSEHAEKGSEEGYLAKDSEHAEKGSEEGYLAEDLEHAETADEEEESGADEEEHKEESDEAQENSEEPGADEEEENLDESEDESEENLEDIGSEEGEKSLEDSGSDEEEKSIEKSEGTSWESFGCIFPILWLDC